MKRVVIYGNCHTTVIKEMLNSVPEFRNQYTITDTPPIQDIKNPTYLYSDIFTNCDIFIHQSIWEKNRYGKEFSSKSLISRLKPGCEVIAIPNVYHMPLCFFPNYSPAPEFLNRQGGTVFFRDLVIDELYSRNCSVKEIVKEYDRENLFPKHDLENRYLQFINKVRKREQDWDIKVSDFIDENKSEQRLFYDPNHPTNYFLAYVANELLSLLHIDSRYDSFNNTHVSKLDIFEMPICYSVKKTFSMTFSYEEMRSTGIKVKNEKMHLEEYIKQYIAMEWQNDSLKTLQRIKSFVRWSEYKAYNLLNRYLKGENHECNTYCD